MTEQPYTDEQIEVYENQRLRDEGHTPGPWHRFGSWQINGPHGEPLAEIIRQGTEADAALIAFAPILLDALERYGQHNRGCARLHLFPDGAVCTCGLTAIIRQAKGGVS